MPRKEQAQGETGSRINTLVAKVDIKSYAPGLLCLQTFSSVFDCPNIVKTNIYTHLPCVCFKDKAFQSCIPAGPALSKPIDYMIELSLQHNKNETPLFCPIGLHILGLPYL